MSRSALLVLEDGTTFEGTSFGAEGEVTGEVIFNTSMTGYQEVLTDPSYAGQMVAMTYPLIGNYGTNPSDVESRSIFLQAFIIKELSSIPSNFRSKWTLDQYLKSGDIMGIQGVDTRALTRHIRLHGAMKGILSTKDLDSASLAKKAKGSPGLVGQDLVKEVTCDKEYEWRMDEWDFGLTPPKSKSKHKLSVIAYDFGIKYNILRLLEIHGCKVTVVPAKTKAKDILSKDPDGIFLSNGPGDPAAVSYAIEEVRQLLGKKPIFGICLGHQILGLALGGKTYKLKFGHHGGNQPVMDLLTKRVAITAQNHGFAVDMKSIKDKDVELTHINLNDKTVEGLRHKKFPLFAVQYHPEAGPGPHDATYLFEEFIKMMEKKDG